MSAPEETPADRPEPVCERHGCKHPLSDHDTAEENRVRPCRACRCPAYSGWARQRGRAGRDE
ncbi:hypothetical protein [Actinoplanes sp. NPDC049118]|uniref:hypothetical protein n=1 Tax=Actinoplanes sp. NPDC049118 TaxID=3155769 RepID=UPI00340460CC